MKKDKRIALVTGASRGIGRAIAIELLQKQIVVIGMSRRLVDDSALQELAAQHHTEYHALAADVSDRNDHQAILSYLKKHFNQLDILIHNAGIAPAERKDVFEMSLESYQKVMDVNLNGPVFLTQLLYPLMEPLRKSYLLFLTSISAVVASANRAEYCVSKAGLSMFSKVLSARLADTGTLVFEIRPGVIQTDMIEGVREKYKKFAEEGGIPSRRLGLPEDIAKAVKSIVGGDFDYAHGQVFEISGGMQIRSL